MPEFILLLVFFAGGYLIYLGVDAWGSNDMIWPLWVAAGLAVMTGAIVINRRMNRQICKDLLAGKDVIARWQLSPADFAAFQAVDRDRALDGKYFRNRLILPRRAPPEGVPIVIGKKSWLIGPRLYASGVAGVDLLANVAMIEGDPGYIEIALLSKIKGPDYLLVLHRLPVPIGARSAAGAAAAHLAAGVPPSNHALLWDYYPEYANGVTA
ncbi:MAG: hypothetical protein QOD42_71 [Sphingomonadales bacterium]|jgi:hypothetical protein|nr:hypothetical protein [Sphingomonadales bacterium]